MLHRKFCIRNDHQALSWLLKCKEPTDRLARWVIEFSIFDFDFEYIEGSKDILADTLSRGVIKAIQMREENTEKDNEISIEKKFEIMFHAHCVTGHSGRETMLKYIQSFVRWTSILKILVIL